MFLPRVHTQFISRVIVILISALLFTTGMFLGVATSKAGYSHESNGWAWGGSEDLFTSTTAGLGWISMNSTDCDLGDDGTVSAAEAALTGCAEGPIADYGVDTWGGGPSIASGYAWSENYGWISFNQSDLTGCPSGVCAARHVSGGYRLPLTGMAGWARILSLVQWGPGNQGGWVKLASESDDTISYGVTYHIRSKEFGGYAYSDEVGWIDFSPVPDSEVGTIDVDMCDVALDENECEGVISWDLRAGNAPYEVFSETTQTILGNTSTTAPILFTLLHGTNQVRATATDLFPAVWTGTVECEEGLFFHTGLGTPVCKQPPEVSIITPVIPTRVSRQQSMVTVEFGVLANFDATCNVYGSVPAGTNVSHTASSSLVLHTFTTDPLLSAQTVEVECGVVGIPESFSSSTMRIDVVPSYQER